MIFARLQSHFVRKVNIVATFMVAAIVISIVFFLGLSLASSTTNISLVVNPGSLAVTLVNSSYQSLSNPQVNLPNISYSTTCQESQGILGTATQKIYIKNPESAYHGWSVTIAASMPSSTWTNGSFTMDFNDPTAGGCADGGDTDSARGQLTLDPSLASFTTGACSTCGTTDIVLSPAGSFQEGVVDSVTLIV